VVAPVLEDYVHDLRVGAPVPLTLDALPGREWTGVISAIVPMADVRSRTFPVKVRLRNPVEGETPLLKAGMFARVHLDIGEKAMAILVPKDALVLGGPAPLVYVLAEDGRSVRPVPVQTGLAVDALIQVTGDVPAGARVVVRGNERLRPPYKVRVLPG
jgi:RND family efflux transporter MFP subunit